MFRVDEELVAFPLLLFQYNFGSFEWAIDTLLKYKFGLFDDSSFGLYEKFVRKVLNREVDIK
jgi:hypothetical protein